MLNMRGMLLKAGLWVALPVMGATAAEPSQVEVMVMFDGPLWPHGAYVERIEGKTFGPPVAEVVMTIGHSMQIRLPQNDGPCSILQMLAKPTTAETLSLEVGFMGCNDEAQLRGESIHAGVTEINIPLASGQRSSVRYDDLNTVEFSVQKRI